MGVFKVDANSLGLLGDENWLSVVSVFDLAGTRQAQFMAEHSLSVPQSRLSRYIRYLHSKYISTYLRSSGDHCGDVVLKYVFQGEDCPRNIKSISWESQRGWSNIRLVPDLYYFMERGYEDFLPEGTSLPAWSERQPAVFWRGSTTGVVQGADIHAVGVSAETLDRLPRYQMCRILRQLGDGANAGIVAVVQCSDSEKDGIAARLMAEGLMANYVPLPDMARYKFLADIDGNTNSWNFIQRMRLGCCILKVESPWIQWFEHRIEPWVHFVPVKSDLSNLSDMVEWCRTHDQEAAQIAENGRAFGLSIRFETEMRQAALDILRASTVLDRGAEGVAALDRVCAAADRLRPAWCAAIEAWSSIPEPMWLETAHGTILGISSQGTPVQVFPTSDTSSAITLSDGDSRWQDQLRGFHIDRNGNELALERGGLFLSAREDRATTVCDRLEKREWETFTLVPARN